MHKVAAILLLALAMSACKNTPRQQTQDHTPDISRFQESYIIMERMGCPKGCPVDVIKLFGTGKVEYIGKKNVDKIGKYSKSLNAREVDHIFNEYECAGYFDYREEYLCGREAETILLTWKHRGWEKTIKDCEAAPPGLKKLQKLCMEVIESEGWEKIY